MRDEITPLTPLEDKPPKISSPKNSAAGIPAVVSTMKYGLTNMGVINSITKLSKVLYEEISSLPGVRFSESSIGLKYYKYDYRWARILD